MNGEPRRFWLCADDYGLSPGVNRAIRDLIDRGRLNATSVMMVGPAIGRDEAAGLPAAARDVTDRGRLTASSLRLVGRAFGRVEAEALQAAAASRTHFAVGLHAT